MNSFIFLLFGYNKNVKNLLIFMEYLPRIFWNISGQEDEFYGNTRNKGSFQLKMKKAKKKRRSLKGLTLR